MGEYDQIATKNFKALEKGQTILVYSKSKMNPMGLPKHAHADPQMAIYGIVVKASGKSDPLYYDSPELAEIHRGCMHDSFKYAVAKIN